MPDTDPSDVIAVVAHGWLNAAAILTGAATTLQQQHERLSAAQRDALLGALVRLCDQLASDLRRSIPRPQGAAG